MGLNVAIGEENQNNSRINPCYRYLNQQANWCSGNLLLEMIFTTVDGSEIRLTSWGNSSWNAAIYQALIGPRWVVNKIIWTIKTINSCFNGSP